MQKITIGLAPNITVEISSDNVKQLIEQTSFWGTLPSVCDLCQAPVVFFHRTPQDNEYFGLVCTGQVRHETNFGQYKQTDRGLYYKGDWKEAYGAYQPGEEGTANTQQPQSASPQQTGNPTSQSLGDMVTSKQLGMILAIAREIKMDAEYECKRVMACDVNELSKRGASNFIEYLQGVQNVEFKVSPTTQPQPQPTAPPISVAVEAQAPAATTAPATHGPQCTCPNCDIPF